MRIPVVALLCLCALPMAQIQDPEIWKRLPNPDGASVWSLSSSGEYLYVSVEINPRDGSQSGAYFRSPDAGRTWEPVRPGVLKGYPILGVDGDRIYARRGDSLVVAGPEGEASWKPVAPFYSGAFQAGHGLLIKAAYIGGLEISIDSGNTWRELKLPRGPGPDLAFLVITRAYLFLAYDYSNEVWRSSDKGSNWQSVFQDSSGRFSPSSISVSEQCLFISNHVSGYRSLDMGNTWAPAPFDTKLGAYTGANAYGGSDKTLFLSDFPGDGNRWYASRDSAKSWTDVTGNLHATFDVKPWTVGMLEFKYRLVAQTNLGLRASDDDGATWAPSEAGLPGASPIELLAAGPRLAVRTYKGGYLLNASSTAYAKMDPLRGFGSYPQISDEFFGARMAFDGSNLFVRAREDSARKAAGLMVSPDSGLTWKYADTGLGSPADLASGAFVMGMLAAGGGKAVVHGGNAGLYFTNSAGRSWTRLSSAPTENLGALAMDGNRIYVWNNATRAKQASLRFSEDNGQTWSELARPSGMELPSGCESILFSPSHIHLLMIDTGNAVQRKMAIVLINKANPAGWRILPIDDFVYHYGMIPAVVKGSMIFTARNKGLVYSDDTGYTWKSLNSGLGPDSNQILSLTLQGERLVAGTATGYLYGISIPAASPVAMAPKSGPGGARSGGFAVEVKRYPSDPEGVYFHYHLPTPAKVTLLLFDIQGRLLEEISRQNDKGGHRIRWGIPASGEKFIYRCKASGTGRKAEEANGSFTR